MSMARVLSFRVFAAAAAVVVVAALVSGCTQQPKQALRLDMEPGRIYMLSMRMLADTASTGADGTTTPLKSRGEFRFTLRMEETTPEGDTVVLVEPQKAQFPLFYGRISRPFETTSFRMQVTPGGRISGFTGTDDMRNTVREAVASANGNPGLSADMLLEAISDEALIALIQPVLAVWPNVPVTAGDEWTRDEIHNPISDTLERTTFQMASMEAGAATISMNTTIAPAGKNPNMSISGTSTGELRVLTADGTIRSYRSSGTSEGSVADPITGEKTTFTSTTEIQAELTAR